MNRTHWIEKLGIPENAEVIFYQNPEFFRSDSFRWERDDERIADLKNAIIKWCLISGVCNRHHKNNGRRQKVCLVIERGEKV